MQKGNKRKVPHTNTVVGMERKLGTLDERIGQF